MLPELPISTFRSATRFDDYADRPQLCEVKHFLQANLMNSTVMYTLIADRIPMLTYHRRLMQGLNKLPPQLPRQLCL